MRPTTQADAALSKDGLHVEALEEFFGRHILADRRHAAATLLTSPRLPSRFVPPEQIFLIAPNTRRFRSSSSLGERQSPSFASRWPIQGLRGRAHPHHLGERHRRG